MDSDLAVWAGSPTSSQLSESFSSSQSSGTGTTAAGSEDEVEKWLSKFSDISCRILVRILTVC